ncbi:metal ABC transporter permease [Synechococcus sp. H60.3]|uniref:metal ABC transporter permease n=3 Tax=Synechococcus TaxID=1129 RepID=UPI0039C1D778
MEGLWHTLADPLRFAFMQRALLVAVAIGVLCAVVGSYLLVQSLALLGDALSHSLLPGLAIAYLLDLNLFVGAFVAGLLSALLIQWIRSATPLKPDAAMGIVFSAFFALGILLITLIQRRARIDLNHFLFGNLLGVSAADVLTVVGITVLVLGLVALFFKELTFYSFDPLGAKAAGLPTAGLGWGLMALTSLTLVASMKAVGVLLVLAMLITPAATAYLLAPRLHQVMLLGSLFGVSASLLGMYASYYLNVASGPAIVLVASVWFGLAFLARVIFGQS